ncbi:holo-[acyl-carrier-protein] synthase [Oceanobacillus limi]|uniref:Holo-[acyl-carrier-protein] synthase n=1 Tax=Oceanobacillus limi TaxID=930131 RepID=A0A1I0H7J0_9BACI|nr:holo-ACP synthase [Oceanobacillus limi]SET79665.1 holo-[acyl-carrier-protein] synthase [Oceanobacillus limi]
MIQGIGIDITELHRIKKSMNKNNRFIKRILTNSEQEIFFSLESEARKVEFLAGRFAGKEAFAKAAGTGIGKLSFQDIEILRQENGAPMIQVSGFEMSKIFISISHSEAYAVAQVVLED